ncbi:hypothetical protein [Pedobacter sandarakinus]|uniref:hypothetical protein n=1 Tax=Pedobacter sandarakinus TaxID=353156 RepID=UPI0022455F1E|nr:hypothetical protein [Pedobacter sandarakinus]MCX2573609.1 hypothetical protein [Pedobacter sandarakinus]
MDNKQLLVNLLAQPGKVGPQHVTMLKDLAQQFPYAQPIHLLLAKADSTYIPKAALYSHGNALFNVLNIVSENDENFEVTEEVASQSLVADDVEETRIEVNTTPAPAEIETPKNLPGIDSHLMDFIEDEDPIIESVAATDFFAFEERQSTDVVPAVPEIETVVPDGHDVNFVSKYDDDQLPYTFLWWLAKTRKEHEQIFQPYAQQKAGVVKKQNQPQAREEFQQQYVEHIFHIQTPFEVADHLAEYPTADVKDPKGAEIIEKFLKEDPTIKPPKPEQIDTENKAKKSAEDRYDLVSETLAKIYIEQMLYHKAIDTYKKLSLKYPEKSGYFADLIQSIEKKF